MSLTTEACQYTTKVRSISPLASSQALPEKFRTGPGNEAISPPCVLCLASPCTHSPISVKWVTRYNIAKCGSLFFLFSPSTSPSPTISAISVELYYIFATVWGREAYTLYGILLVVFLILISVTACISVALTYFQLSTEDYRWWWRSIFSSG